MLLCRLLLPTTEPNTTSSVTDTIDYCPSANLSIQIEVWASPTSTEPAHDRKTRIRAGKVVGSPLSNPSASFGLAGTVAF